MPSSNYLAVLNSVALVPTDLADTIIQKLSVTGHEFGGPGSGLIHIPESTSDILKSEVGGSQSRFRKSVAVARPWSGWCPGG